MCCPLDYAEPLAALLLLRERVQFSVGNATTVDVKVRGLVHLIMLLPEFLMA